MYEITKVFAELHYVYIVDNKQYKINKKSS